MLPLSQPGKASADIGGLKPVAAVELVDSLGTMGRSDFMFACALLAAAAAQAGGAAQFDPGADAAEIRIGNIASYSGVAQEYATVARAEAAYFRMINDRGGVNGRRITFISIDDGSDAGRARALAQRLVEQEQVLALFSTFGTDANLAIRDYANQHHVPQLFVEASSAAFDDPAHFPWTMGFFPTYRTEGLAYADYLLRHRPDAKIALLYEDSPAGAEFMQGVRDGLGPRAASMIVQQASYHAGDASIEPQVDSLKASGADVFMDLAWGTAASAAIRRAYDIGWHPL
jgi:branched-chain amino acid transport system substrate-binding protein